MKLPRQCAVLVGGSGTRLGSLTANMPKPLLDCGGRPFLAWVLRELSRFGIEEIVLLAGYKSEHIEKFCRDVPAFLPKPLTIRTSIEPSPAGTGGALWHARDMLDDTFLLINGDSWIDTNLARLFAAAADAQDAMGCMLLAQIDDCSRYGLVELSGRKVVSFREKSSLKSAGTINGGMLVLSKDVLNHVSPNCSLEKDVLPVLVARGLLQGVVGQGFFIDIGIPSDYALAQTELPRRLKRPAIFFDRDGVLNQDAGWVGTRERFSWMEGAKEAVRQVNDAGYHAFIVTNQAGVAKGFYEESHVEALHRWMIDELRAFGATIDDIRYCPDHPDAVHERYRKESDWRKPGPRMITDLIAKWEVTDGGFLVGDKESDLQAARAANIPGYMFTGGNLANLIGGQLSRAPSASHHRVPLTQPQP